MSKGRKAVPECIFQATSKYLGKRCSPRQQGAWNQNSFFKTAPKNFKWVNLKLAARFIKIHYYENNLNTGGWFISETFYRLIYHSSLSILPLKTPLYLSLTDFSQEKRLNITFCERRTRKKTLGVSLRMNHTFNPHATPNLGVEPRPQWREVSALTKCKARFRIGSGEKSSP